MAVGTVALLAAGVLPVTTGSAQPRPSLASVQREIAGLQLEVDMAVEDYDTAGLALADWLGNALPRMRCGLACRPSPPPPTAAAVPASSPRWC